MISISREDNLLTWVEIDQKALRHNIAFIRHLIGNKVLLAATVKANAYGHGLIETSKILLNSGADWLNVNAVWEAEELRKAGIVAPLFIMGYVMKQDLALALQLDCRLVVYNTETLVGLSRAARKLKKQARVHLKVETGNHRQGILIKDVVNFVTLAKKFTEIEIEGISTHFANIEDMDRREFFAPNNYAQQQLHYFKKTISELEKIGVKIHLRHCANSAATLLFPETHFDMVRPGIALYGLWPSLDTKKILQKKYPACILKPVLTWKTRIAQIKEIPRGAFIGYGCTYRTKGRTRLAILPVGYADGYDRSLSNNSHVLIHGKRAPLRGRVCMNMIIVDITKIPEARLEDPVTLLGKNGEVEVTAGDLALFAKTIHYEITTRINSNIPRLITN